MTIPEGYRPITSITVSAYTPTISLLLRSNNDTDKKGIISAHISSTGTNKTVHFGVSYKY